MIQKNIVPKLRPLWLRICSLPMFWMFFAFISLTILRAYGTVGGAPGQFIMLGFLLMWFVPWVFLTKDGRNQIGLKFPIGIGWIGWAPFVGLAMAFLSYALGILLYGASEQHWFQSVAASFFEDERVLEMPRDKLFIMFTIPAMIFSPIGEEILFRGWIQKAFQSLGGPVWGVVVSAVLFAGVHLLHHGIHRTVDGWTVFWISGFVWFVLMFITSVGFSWLRMRYRSILPSILAHSVFNLVMNATIFYLMLAG